MVSVRVCRLIFLFLFLASSLAACRNPEPERERTDYDNWAPEARYIGKEACGECHSQNYSTYLQSEMGRSWKKASLSLSIANFEDPDPVYSEHDDMYYQPFHRGEDLFVKAYRLENGDTVHTRIEQIDYIVGSGQHTNSHIYEENGFLYQVPVTWYAQDGIWDLAPGFQHRSRSPFDRPITSECMACHNGVPQFEKGSENRFLYVPSGIGCERCHGPGSIHRDAIKAGRQVNVDRDIDYTIVHPGKLSPERQLDLCKRCHMQAAEVMAPDVVPEDFRPGQALSSFQNVYWIRQPDSALVFNMASHPDRLEMSKCFRETWRDDSDLPKLTCVTCHNPHLSIELVSDDYYTALCKSCHETNNHIFCSEPSVLDGTDTTPCASCHMPTSGSKDIPHIRVTDHYIRKPGVEERRLSHIEMEEQKRFIRLVGLVDSNPSLKDRADGLLSYFELITNRPGILDSADVYMRRAIDAEPELDVTRSMIRLRFLQEDYMAVRRMVLAGDYASIEDAWTLYRIGESFAATGDFPTAAHYFGRALGLGPDHLRIKDRLAVIFTDLGDYEQAIALFDEILFANPKFENAYTNRGFVFLAQGRFEEAEADFRGAIALNPDSETAMANLASLYFNTQREEQARPLVRRLIRLQPENPEYARLWRLLDPFERRTVGDDAYSPESGN